MNLLNIEREATYRRLRKGALFSILEIAKISFAWNISLDSLFKVSSSAKVPFLMQPVNYITPSKQELEFLKQVIQSIICLKDYPETEFMDICNKLPRLLLAGFGRLNQFYLFKWLYQFGNEKNACFSQTVISDEMRQLTAEYYRAIKTAPHTSFIFDRMLFEDIVSEIRYFSSIQLITSDEKELIREDLYCLIDYLSEIATNGCYPETQNKVDLYISQLSVDANYSYSYSNGQNTCFIHVFDKYEIYTFDNEMAANIITWMQLKKRTSIHISGMDEKSRMEFFTKQRKIIDSLNDSVIDREHQ
jgi:hypothetical protein